MNAERLMLSETPAAYLEVPVNKKTGIAEKKPPQALNSEPFCCEVTVLNAAL